MLNGCQLLRVSAKPRTYTYCVCWAWNDIYPIASLMENGDK